MIPNESLPAPIANDQTFPKRLLLASAIAGMLVTVLVFPFPNLGRHWSEIFNLAHAPSFFAAFLLVAGLLDPSSIGFPKSLHTIVELSAARLILLVVVLLAIGAACEVLQQFVNRSPSLSDLLANASGLFAGLFWCLSVLRIGTTGRIGFSLVAAALLIGAGYSPIMELHDCYLQHQNFPLLASFERQRELHAWYPHEASIAQSTIWSTDGSTSLEVQGIAGTKYPGTNFQWPIEDWHEFKTLELDIFNPGDDLLLLRMNITDKLHAASGRALSDRFTIVVELPPGKRVPLHVKLSDVADAPATRTLDLRQIESLNLFIVLPETDFVFMVDNVRLTKN